MTFNTPPALRNVKKSHTNEMRKKGISAEMRWSNRRKFLTDNKQDVEMTLSTAERHMKMEKSETR